jgi:hypothetical protein
MKIDLVNKTQYLLLNAADMAAFDCLPPIVRKVLRESLVCPPATEVAQWVQIFGEIGAVKKLQEACRELHNYQARQGIVCQLRPSDSLSI